LSISARVFANSAAAFSFSFSAASRAASASAFRLVSSSFAARAFSTSVCNSRRCASSAASRSRASKRSLCLRLSFSAFAAARRSASAAAFSKEKRFGERGASAASAGAASVPESSRGRCLGLRLVSPHRAHRNLCATGCCTGNGASQFPHTLTISTPRAASWRPPRIAASPAILILARHPRRQYPSPASAPTASVALTLPASAYASDVDHPRSLALARPKHTIATRTETAANTTVQLVASAIVSRSAVAGTPSTARSSALTRREKGR
jgi:hypothetical protein